MRVGILGLMHESNTFIAERTTLGHFQRDQCLVGPEVSRLADTHHETGGYFAALAEAGIEAVPIFFARAIPSGTITAEAYESLWQTLERELRAAGPLDGVLAAAHGAAVCESAPDMDGDWLSRLREIVGKEKPVIGTLDPHANLSPRMVAATDALVAYRTNPHMDQRAVGMEAGRLMVRTLAGEIRPTQAAAFPPVVINIERQSTSQPPVAPLLAKAAEMKTRPGMLSTNLVLGFPYADVAEMGAAVLAVADGDPQLAQAGADELGAAVWRERETLRGELISLDEALDRSANLPGPVGLLDMGDNVGGGAPGDSMWLAQAIHERRLGPAVATVCDPNVAEQARVAGVGAVIDVAVGGKSDARHGRPLAARVTVVGLSDGQFSEPQPRHGGYATFDQGPSAVVRTDHGLTLLVTPRPMPPFSLRQLTSCGIEPERFKLIVIKGVHAPIAAYQPVCPSFIRVNTRGATSADLREFEFTRRRRPLFPFEG